MKRLQPRGLSRRRVASLLSEAKDSSIVAGRIEILSLRFLGRPYKPNPLVGSADTAEEFTASLDGFDCVTYLETVLALAHASNVDDFIRWLRKIRYERGRIEWRRRNHYMTRWIRSNVVEKILKPVPMPDLPVVAMERILNVVPGLDPIRIRMKCVPKSSAARLERNLRSGDLIFFASTRKNLDVFHAGIIVRAGRGVRMRHASRSLGGVVEQKFREFLKANRMAGVIVARPRETAPRSRA